MGIELTNVHGFSILGIGFLLGLKHSFDADHLLAVSTIVSERKSFWSSSFIGMLWGLGHTASLLIVGLAVIVFHLQIPEPLGRWMEVFVALMLTGLGVHVLWKIHKGATFHLHIHSHHDRVHVHPHFHESSAVHSHNKEHLHHHSVKIGKKPIIVGMMHGLAGSAGLMLMILATISSQTLAMLYIGIFGAGSIGGMMLMSMVIAVPFALTARYQRLHMIVRTTAGILSVGSGIFLAWHIGIVKGLFL